MLLALSELLRTLLHCSNHLPALRIDFWNVPLEGSVIYGIEVLSGTAWGSAVEDSSWGVIYDRHWYPYARAKLDESLRIVLRGVRNATLVDASEDMLMHVSRAFRNAEIICA